MLLGTKAVKFMVQIIQANSWVEKHDFHFDDFFTSYKLLNELTELGLCSTDTLRENRTQEAEQPLSLRKCCQKKKWVLLSFVTMKKYL